MKRLFSILFLMSAVLAFTGEAAAQLRLDGLESQARFDFQRESVDRDADLGFKGRYLNLYLNGSAGERLTYSWRQRFTKPVNSSSYWDATDWVWLDWKFNDMFSVNVGKQVVAIGGFEYDRAPINLFQCSEYWNNIACYQFGISGSLRINPNDKLTFQICQSPNRRVANNMFAYNIIWYGRHGLWSSIWSANLMESQPGRYVNYITLGNRFDFGPLALELDWMNRSAKGKSMFGDFSVMAELSAKAGDYVDIFAKYTFDRNDFNDLDFCVLPGTRISRAGVGANCFPMKNDRSLRIHAQVAYAFGENGNPNGVLQNRQLLINCGVTYFFDILKAIRNSR